MKTIVITGANGNLGAATVRVFLQSGYKVIAIGRTGSNLGFAAGNPAFERYAIDLADEAAAADFVKMITGKEHISGALLLAGGHVPGHISAANTGSIRDMIRLNFETAFNIARPLFEYMMQQGHGRIVLTGAKTALEPAMAKHSIAYALSKSMLFSLAEMLNATAKGKDVTVCVVAPSTIDTQANRQAMPDADPDKWVKAEDIAGIMEFICNDKSAAIRETVFKVYNNA